MAVTFGFYNSRNGDRVYDANQMSSIFSGIIRDGVFANFPQNGQSFVVDWATGFRGRKAVIGPGRAWFNNTWTDNDSNIVLEFDAPNNDASIDRIDAIVLEINKNIVQDSAANMYDGMGGTSAGGNAVPGRTNKFMIVKGQEGSNPRAPTLRNGDGIYQYYIALARITKTTSRQTITSKIGVSGGTPYITCPLDSIDSTQVLQEWTQAFNAEIDRFRATSAGAINDACNTYFNDPNSMIYQQISGMRTEFDGRLDLLEGVTRRSGRRRHIWIIDKPVSTVPGYAETYSKSEQGGATPAHNIYPDFYQEEQFDEENSPKIGDVIIGNNGYYAVITHWDDRTGYSMIISSTGKNIIDNSFKIYFTNGHYIDGTVDPIPAECTKTFAQIKAAYEAGLKIEAYLEFGEQVHTTGHEGYWAATDLLATVEYGLRDNVLEEVVASLIYYEDRSQQLLKHSYKIDRYGVTNEVTVIA